MDILKELKIVGLSSSYVQKDTFAIILKDKSSELRLPIIIGINEAQSIALELERMKTNRPLTHDLFVSFSKKGRIKINKIVITNLDEGIFYAQIHCTNNSDINNAISFKLDSRPSDAIAIGLKCKAPIFTTLKVLNEAGIDVKDDDKEEKEKKTTKKEQAQKKQIDPDDIESLSMEEINMQLKQAVDVENYEYATVLKKEIDRRSKENN